MEPFYRNGAVCVCGGSSNRRWLLRNVQMVGAQESCYSQLQAWEEPLLALNQLCSPSAIHVEIWSVLDP